MLNDKMGINESKINNLMLDIYDYEEQINALFDKITDIMEKSNNSFQSDNADDLRKKYRDFSINYTNIKNNIHDYSDDLSKVKNMYTKKDMAEVKHILKPIVIDETIRTGSVNYEHK